MTSSVVMRSGTQSIPGIGNELFGMNTRIVSELKKSTNGYFLISFLNACAIYSNVEIPEFRTLPCLRFLIVDFDSSAFCDAPRTE